MTILRYRETLVQNNESVGVGTVFCNFSSILVLPKRRAGIGWQPLTGDQLLRKQHSSIYIVLRKNVRKDVSST